MAFSFPSYDVRLFGYPTSSCLWLLLDEPLPVHLSHVLAFSARSMQSDELITSQLRAMQSDFLVPCLCNDCVPSSPTTEYAIPSRMWTRMPLAMHLQMRMYES